jgi:hypothetical protein
MSRRRIGVAAVGLVATVAGCGGGVKYAGQDIDSDVAFLSRIEEQFRADAGRGTAKVGDGSHCWLLKDKDSGEIDSIAACGPIRHLGATENGVWDMYRFKGTVSGKSVSVDQITVDRTGATLPADREPFRGDDARVPDNAGALPAPEAPPAKPGMAKVVPDAKVENVAKPGKGKLIIPGATIQATEVGDVKTLPGDEQSPVYRPADGEEFRAISVKLTKDFDFTSGSIDTKPTYSVKTGSQKAPLELDKLDTGEPQLIVVSVPKGQDADLVVTVASLDQTLSVRSGDRTSTTAAAYYRGNTTVALNKQFATQTVKVGQFEIGHRVTFTEARLTPFDAYQGWAPDGKLWVELRFADAGMNDVGAHKGSFNWKADAARQLSVVDDRDRRTPVTVPANLTGKGGSEGVVPIQVAADAKRVTIGYAPVGTFTKYRPDYQVTPASGSFAFRKLTFRITLPQ